MRYNGQFYGDGARQKAMLAIPFTDKEKARGGLFDSVLCESVGNGWGGDDGKDKPGSFAYESRREDDLYLLSNLLPVSVRCKFDKVSRALAPLAFAASMPHARATVAPAKARAAMRQFWIAALTLSGQVPAK